MTVCSATFAVAETAAMRCLLGPRSDSIRGMREHEIRLLRSLVASLDAIKAQVKTIAENSRPCEQISEPEQPPISLNAVLQLPAAVANYYESKTTKKPRLKIRQWISVFLSAATLVAVVAYTCITSRMWHAQLESNDISRSGTVIAQRAFVFFLMSINRSPITDEMGTKAVAWNFAVPIENSGNTPTKNLFIGGKIEVDRALPAPYQDGVAPGPRLFLAAHTGYQTAYVRVETNRLKESRIKPIYFYGWARYNDIFDATDRTTQHITMYCFKIEGFAGDPSVPTAVFNPLYGVCSESHNCADDECDGESYGNGQVWHATKK